MCAKATAETLHQQDLTEKSERERRENERTVALNRHALLHFYQLRCGVVRRKAPDVQETNRRHNYDGFPGSNDI